MEIPDIEISAWATFLAVAVALGIGITSIIQIKRIQEGESRHRQVKEIEEWSKDVIKFTTEYQVTTEPGTFFGEWHGRWGILKETKTHMKEAADDIDEAFGRVVGEAITAFDALDKTADEQKRTRRNIDDHLYRCQNACKEVTRSTGLLKFKKLR
jgi:hypothetical protein